jgi:hypothetical protein
MHLRFIATNGAFVARRDQEAASRVVGVVNSKRPRGLATLRTALKTEPPGGDWYGGVFSISGFVTPRDAPRLGVWSSLIDNIICRCHGNLTAPPPGWSSASANVIVPGGVAIGRNHFHPILLSHLIVPVGVAIDHPPWAWCSTPRGVASLHATGQSHCSVCCSESLPVCLGPGPHCSLRS